VATGDERFATLFLADRPDEFSHVPFNDLDAMEAALKARDVAAVIMETIPATYGFPPPAPGYLAGVKSCERYGALYIADEVQTGLMRTGELWAISKPASTRTSWSPARHLRRHVPGQRGARDRGRRGLADRGRLRPHVHVRRRRTRLRGGAEDAGDHR
jgi:hypothetical protein